MEWVEGPNPWTPMMITAFCDTAPPCSIVEVDRRFRGTYCFHHQGDEYFRLMMEAVRTSEMSVNFYETARHNNPQDCHFHTRRRENLKSHIRHASLLSYDCLLYFVIQCVAT
jgi:hypothetical protein